MRTTATFVAIASATAFAQEIGSTDGPSVVSGPNAISAPNVNNGWQAEGSFFSGVGADSQGSTPDVFANVIGSTFTSVNSNSLSKGNIVNNPSSDSVAGNDGWTANGDSNMLGPVQNQFGHGFVRRGGDVAFVGTHHEVNRVVPGFSQGFVPVTASGFVTPGFAAPGFVNNGVVNGVYKRNGDVVFANNHHQANTLVGAQEFGLATPQFVQPMFAPQFIQPVFAPQFVQPVAAPVAVPEVVAPVAAAPVAAAPVVVAPIAAEQNGQKATVIQNQA